jgi:hypothetical protein
VLKNWNARIADLPFAEYKTEVAIDRVTSAAHPVHWNVSLLEQYMVQRNWFSPFMRRRILTACPMCLKLSNWWKMTIWAALFSRQWKNRFESIQLTARAKKDYGKPVDLGTYSSIQK